MRNLRHLVLLLVFFVAILPAQAQIRDGRLTYGGTFEGRIDVEGEFAVIGFTGNAGDVVTATVVAPDSATLDPIVYILYGDIPFSYNDDAEDASVGSFNAQLRDVILPHDGTYDLYVGGYSGTGNFSVTLEKAGSLTEIDAFPISYGETVTGTLDASNNFFFYQFEASAGDDVAIDMPSTSSSHLDTSFILYDSDLFALAVIDDNNTQEGDYDAGLESYVLADAGTYYLVATRFEGVGTFSLSLNSGNAIGQPSAPANTGGSALAYGEGATGFIDATTAEIHYTFNGAAGDVVTITMVAEENTNLDSVLRLLDPSGNVVAENDDAADLSLGRFNSQIVAFELPASGEYTIVATRFSGSGNFTISLETDVVGSNTSPSGEVTEQSTDSQRLLFVIPDGWISAPDNGSMLIASNNELLAQAQVSLENVQLTNDEIVMVVVIMPLYGLPLDEIFRDTHTVYAEENVVYGDSFESGANSAYVWYGVDAEYSGTSGFLHGVDVLRGNGLFIQTFYAGDRAQALQVVENFINELYYE